MLGVVAFGHVFRLDADTWKEAETRGQTQVILRIISNPNLHLGIVWSPDLFKDLESIARRTRSKPSKLEGPCEDPTILHGKRRPGTKRA